MKLEPVAYVWNGSEMVPLDRFANLARRQYRAGQEYVLIDHKGRSEESHNHYHACVKKGFDNLPEEYIGQIQSPLALRKRCLILEGYADQTDHICEDEETEAKLIMFARKFDPYVLTQRTGNILSIWVAQSQDHASMGHKVFQESKDRVLSRIANMCGISLEELTKNAKETT